MRAYQSKYRKISGTSYSELYKKANRIYLSMKSQTKRRVYVRSKYFGNDKVFLSLFWQHQHSKLNIRDKARRIRYYNCALDLIRNTKFHPTSKEAVLGGSYILHRFTGITVDKEIFLVQIKENKRNGQKYFLSVFPLE